MIKSAYIHIPFCNHICSYCDFCKMLYKKEWVDSYLDALEEEINTIYQNVELETIYIGGGTPSCLDLNQLERLFQILEKLHKKANIEYTIEGNFDTTTLEKLLLYKKYGINRLSFGLESTHPENWKLLDRQENLQQVRDIIHQAKELGFNNINIDLMYALPTETIEMVQKDLNFILSLDIEHISTYSLIIEEHTKLHINHYQNIEEDLDEKMYQKIIKTLKKNHFHHYEISNFAKPGKYSKHNTCYWNNEEYYGFGLGASSYRNNKRTTNTRSLSKYIEKKWIKEEETLSRKDKQEYEIILNLRKQEGINLKEFKEKYKKHLEDLYDISHLLKENFIQKNEEYLWIPEEKWYISNEIIVKILGSEKNG